MIIYMLNPLTLNLSNVNIYKFIIDAQPPIVKQYKKMYLKG